MKVKIAFIPHSVLVERVIEHETRTLIQIMEKTGADHAEYHHHTTGCTCRCCGKSHIVLTNPSMPPTVIGRELGKPFSLNRVFVWVV